MIDVKLDIPKSLQHRLQTQADEQNVSFNSYVVAMLKRSLEATVCTVPMQPQVFKHDHRYLFCA